MIILEVEVCGAVRLYCVILRDVSYNFSTLLIPRVH